MASFSQFLDSLDPQTKGKQFEVFVKWFLKQDPEWSTQVDQIWLWDEYPHRWGPDCGIDLVFKHKNSEVWAVQAKCYSQEYSITKSDVDTFLSESNRSTINKRLLVASTDLIGANAKRTCDNQEKDVIQYLYSDFEKAEIDYPESFSELDKAKRKDPPKPRSHQSEAVDAVEKGFKENNRGQLIMACGTGKTYTTLWIKERLNSQSTLVLVPSLSLLSQTLKEWTFASKQSFDVLCVCSDETVGKNSSYDSISQSVNGLSFPVTSDVEEIKSFLKSNGPKVIFSTYQSSPIISQSQRGIQVPPFELVIADEAHRCTGNPKGPFTTVLDESLLKSNRRLFATATPKIYKANIKKKAEERGINITSMDNEDNFGKVFYSLPFGEAIKRKLLTDYQVVIVGVDKPMIAEWIENRELLKTSFGEITDAESLAGQIGLIKAIKDYDLKRIITFHSRISGAESFASETQKTIKNLSKKHVPNAKIWTDFVSGIMNSEERNKKLKKLKELYHVDIGILSNARCLSEGIDVPALDGVAFIDPKRSHIDILQAIGRAIRLSKEKIKGTIFLPVFVENTEDAVSSIENSNFKPVWNILNALKSHDDVLSNELDQLRTNLGRRNRTSTNVSLSKIFFDLPRIVDKSFEESLNTIIIEKTTSSWDFMYGLLLDFVEMEGHARPQIEFVTLEGYPLGTWAGTQRQNKDSLSQEKTSKLESLHGWAWNILEFNWGLGCSHLENFVKQEGHALVPINYKGSDGFAFGKWVRDTRNRADKLNNERKKRLDALGFVWDVSKHSWYLAFEELNLFYKENNNIKVIQKYKTKSGFFLHPWIKTQQKRKEFLESDQIKLLESIPGWKWINWIEEWNSNFEKIKNISSESTQCIVPDTVKDFDRLRQWMIFQRGRKNTLEEEFKEKLESLPGWTWYPNQDKWQIGLNYLNEYVKENGSSYVPNDFSCSDGYRLGSWITVQRSYKDKLSQERKRILEAIPGWIWAVKEYNWNEGFNHLKEFKEINGHLNLENKYISDDGFKLGQWTGVQRTFISKMSKERNKKLDELGFIWDKKENLWNLAIKHTKDYVSEFKNIRVSRKYRTEDGFPLASWIERQRYFFGKGELSKENISKLESIPEWTWNLKEDVKEQTWNEGIIQLTEYSKKYGKCKIKENFVAKNGFKLQYWVTRQRQFKNKLTEKKIQQLESIKGWFWNSSKNHWEEGIKNLKEFANSEGHCKPMAKHKTKDGFELGMFVSNLRARRDKNTKEMEQILESLPGWTWDVLEEKWSEGFNHLKEFKHKFGHLDFLQQYISDDGFKLGQWTGVQRTFISKMSKERKNILDSLGFIWNTIDQQWEDGFLHYEEYVKQTGSNIIIQTYKTLDGYNLGSWANTQRFNYKNGNFSSERKKRLDELGFIWDVLNQQWEDGYSHLKKIFEKEGHVKVLSNYVTENGFKLRSWVDRQRSNKEKMSKERKDKLDSLGFEW